MTVATLRPSWMDVPDVATFIALCDAHNLSIRFVGGCVRDGLLGRAVHDIDVATDAWPDTVMARLADADCRTVPTGLAHGTVTVIVGKTSFEVTTLRADVNCDGRHATVAFGASWEADAQRRDFTMNALMLSPCGTLYDYTSGIDDARAGKVVFIGNAAARIDEDYLRILRLFRFYAYYGHVPIAHNILALCQDAAANISDLSVERVSYEMRKLLCAPSCVQALDYMQQASLFPVITQCNDVPAIACVSAMEQLEVAHNIVPNTVIRLLALYGENAAAIARHWRWSNVMRNMLIRIISCRPLIDVKAVTQSLYHMPRGEVKHALLLQAARGDDIVDITLLKDLSMVETPVFPLKAKDLMAQGMPQGKALGDALRALEAQWLDSGCTLSKATLLAEN